MKTNKIFFILVCLLSISHSAITQIPTNNLVGHYKFDGNSNDLSGNNNNAINYGGEFVSDRFGNENMALYLDGISDSIGFPIPEFAPITGNFAISFWYKTNTPKIANLFSSKQSATDTTDNFEIQINSHNPYYLQNLAQIFYSTYVYWNGDGENINEVSEGSPGAFTKNEWSHFAISRSQDTIRIYRNHVLTSLAIENFFSGTMGDVVDLIFSAAPHLFKGAVDDFRFYNRSLNQAEINFLWFENSPFMFQNIKSTDAYVQGSNVLVSWEYDESQISDSILVETRMNDGDWIPAPDHGNHFYETFIYLDMSYPVGTKIEVRVSDFSNPTLTNSTGELLVSEYDWVEVQGTLPFNAKDGSGMLVFQDKMWLLGGWDPPYHEPNATHSEVWSSSDGVNWEYITTAPWPARHASAWLVGNGAMWVIGGDPQSGCLTDVWKSEDGINWIETNHAIPGFVPRNNQNYAFLNGKLTVYGGEQCSVGPLNEVWTSADGVSWNQEQSAPWLGRGMQINSCVDGSGNMWMLGGSNEGTRRSYNDVWKSADGINWTLVNESAPWGGRHWHTVAWFDNKIWLLAGMATGTEMNDVWYSEDGITWKEIKSTTGNWPSGTRHAQSTTVFDNALWYACGINTNSAWKIINTSVNHVKLDEKKINAFNLSIYPNPSNGIFTLESNEKFENIQIEIEDFTGRVIHTQKLKNGVSKEEIEVSTTYKGIYFIKLTDNQNNYSVKRIVIQ